MLWPIPVVCGENVNSRDSLKFRVIAVLQIVQRSIEVTKIIPNC